MKTFKLHFYLIIFVLFFTTVKATTKDNLSMEKSANYKWEQSIKTLLYDKNEVILNGDHMMTLDTPYRALDAAIVPISLFFKTHQTNEMYVKSVTFIADENPAPIIGKFFLTPKSGNADISTRIRIDRYTYVRAIAEMNDGKKYMVSNFVKAAGGCSAPSLADMDSVMARLGKMKMKLIETGEIGQLNKAQFIISHPNFSGLQFSQLTRTEIPAHFVNSVKITQNQKVILEVEADISISEDPSFTFHYFNSGGPLFVEVTDSEGSKFTQNWPVSSIISSWQ